MPQVPLIIEPDPDDPGCATIMADGTVAGRPYRFIVDTGAARPQLEADEYTGTLPAAPGEASSGVFASAPPQPRNLLGMDVLRGYRCLFRLQAGSLDVDAPAGYQAGHDLRTDNRGHVYVDVQWPGVTAQACWDTGAGITIVNRDFWLAHLSGANSTIDLPMDLILGYPTLRQADWLFDFPPAAGR